MRKWFFLTISAIFTVLSWVPLAIGDALSQAAEAAEAQAARCPDVGIYPGP